MSLRPGHSRPVIQENITLLVDSGKSHGEATAIARRAARNSLRQKLEVEGVETFRAGNYPGKMRITEGDIQRVARTYNEHQAGKGTRVEAPIAFTHEPGHPALGWVSKVEASGRSLITRFRDTTDELLDGIIDERYPNPSIELRPQTIVGDRDLGLTLKAVKFLGGDPPAVKDIPLYSEDAEGRYILFAEWQSNDNDGGKPMDDPTTQKVEITVKSEPTPSNAPTNTDPQAGTGGTSFSEDDVKRLQKEAAEKARQEAEAKFAEEQAATAEAARHAGNLEFCEGLVKAGKLTPGDRDLMVGVLNALTPDMKFGEGDSTASLADAFRDKLSKLAETGLFKEQSPKGNTGLPPEDMPDDQSDEAKMKRITSYSEGGNGADDYEAAKAAYINTGGGTFDGR